MAFLRLVALLFAEVNRAMMTGSAPDGSALLQTAIPSRARPERVPFNIWPSVVADTVTAKPPPERRAPEADEYVEVVVDDDEPSTEAAPARGDTLPVPATHRGIGNLGVWGFDHEETHTANIAAAEADEVPQRLQ